VRGGVSSLQISEYIQRPTVYAKDDDYPSSRNARAALWPARRREGRKTAERNNACQFPFKMMYPVVLDPVMVMAVVESDVTTEEDKLLVVSMTGVFVKPDGKV
jgi:hypothetical protein